MTINKKKRVRTHTNPLSFRNKMEPIDLGTVFPGYTGKIDFEIGCGKGVFMHHYAQENPDRYIVGIEVRKSMVEALTSRLNQHALSNAHVLHGAAQRCLEDIVVDNSIERVFIFHPDPWFKKRHHKRRVINKSLLETLKIKLKENARVYISTDVESLWHAMVEELLDIGGFKQIEKDGFWETSYQTHWGLFSEKDKRSLFCGTFQYLPPINDINA